MKEMFFFLTDDLQPQWRAGNVRNLRAWANGCAAGTHHRTHGAVAPCSNALLASRLRQTRRHWRITTQLAHRDAIGALRRNRHITTHLAHYDARYSDPAAACRPDPRAGVRDRGLSGPTREWPESRIKHHDFKRAPLATGWRPDLSLESGIILSIYIYIYINILSI